jgi:hypothetical protein
LDPQSFSDINSIEDADLAKDELIDLRTKKILQLEFNSKSAEEFWCFLREAYPHLVKQAMEALIPLATIHLCKLEFSTLAKKKSKLITVFRQDL